MPNIDWSTVDISGMSVYNVAEFTTGGDVRLLDYCCSRVREAGLWSSSGNAGSFAGAAEPVRESFSVWQRVNNRCVHAARPATPELFCYCLHYVHWHAGEEYSVVNFQQCNYGTTYQLTENIYHKTQLARMVTPCEQLAQQAARCVGVHSLFSGHRACDQRQYLAASMSTCSSPSWKSRRCSTENWQLCRTAHSRLPFRYEGANSVFCLYVKFAYSRRHAADPYWRHGDATKKS